MAPWPFVIAAYGLTFIATLATSLWAWRSARQAEARADQLTRRD
ncbi:heme exporter protein CcmD [Sphingobium nicotianae]|uniref:Heme exporter protein D n=1 Tax=Sphingobium nicotianae TaxID=2782607 RepID=A0A9X1AI82_9SPHN|nr:heme exporter protein CcmD [Sphingobium nicotianae]MBT2185771.1 heme exporter protein CcmD [Sphingobium nicotianae]